MPWQRRKGDEDVVGSDGPRSYRAFDLDDGTWYWQTSQRAGSYDVYVGSGEAPSLRAAKRQAEKAGL